MTGAASGLGRAFVEELLREGGSVLASDVNESGLERLARELDAGDRLVVSRADVAVAEDVEALARAADDRWGGADLVVNNAGIGIAGPVGEVPLSEWRRVVAVNYWGVVHGCHAFVPRMRAAKRGWVLNVASMAGLVSMPEMSIYNSTKAAVVALSETLRAELADTSVGVSVLCPSFFPTNILANGVMYGSNAELGRSTAERLSRRSPLDARGVARFALDRSRAGVFYLLPHRDAHALWRFKRAMPESWASTVKMLRRFVGR